MTCDVDAVDQVVGIWPPAVSCWPRGVYNEILGVEEAFNLVESSCIIGCCSLVYLQSRIGFPCRDVIEWADID